METMVVARIPDRAGFDSKHGAVVAVRNLTPAASSGFGAGTLGAGPRVVIGDKTLAVDEAASYRDAITAALGWLEDMTRADDTAQVVARNPDPWAQDH